MTDDGGYRHCQHIREDGSPCKTAFGLSSEGLCFAHDPLRQTERARASRLGGRNRQRQHNKAKDVFVTPEQALPEPTSLRDAQRWSAWLAHAVVTGQIDSSRAGVAVRALREYRATTEKIELEAEVKELQATVDKLKREARGRR